MLGIKFPTPLKEHTYEHKQYQFPSPAPNMNVDLGKYFMNTYIMLIMLLHLDPGGFPYTTTLQEDPVREFTTLRECEQASEIKRESMLKSSLKYPDLGIQNVLIRCVDADELSDGTVNI